MNADNQPFSPGEKQLPSFADLRIHYFSDKSESRKVGRYREYTTKEYAMTALGEIELRQWQDMAEKVISAHHEEALQKQLFEWVQETFPWLNTPSKQKVESLDLHMSRMFDNPLWVQFVPFNQRYRPDVLREAHLVKVKTSCCEGDGVTTKEQVDEASSRGGTICCPNCGRFSSFEIAKNAPERETTKAKERGR